MGTNDTYPTAGPPDTPSGMSVALPIDAIEAVPLTGSGLSGTFHVGDWRLRDIAAAEELVASRGPDATFIAGRVLFAAKDSETSLADFLADDGTVTSGDGGLEMGPSGLAFTGHVFIPAGVHTLTVVSDDGFRLTVGGADFMAFESTRAAEATSRTAEFEGGLYEVELLYFDRFARMELSFAIDGLPVDASAFWREADDILADAPPHLLVPVEDYHPSRFPGPHVLDGPGTPAGTAAADVLEGDGGDDTVDAGVGDDVVRGGYGDDLLSGGAGDDVVDGGRGSDYVRGGAGDDVLVSRSDTGEQRIGQLALGEPTRDGGGAVDPDRQKLIGFEGQPLIGDDILEGGEGADVFLFTPLLNGKLEIIAEHVRSDGTVNWAGVAGENALLHDHWVDNFGIDIVADFDSAVDRIAVIGHTANVDVDHRDIDTDGDGTPDTPVSVITAYSRQHGGGGAHTLDLLGQVIVHGDRVEADDIITDAGVTHGVVETFAEVAEALHPVGAPKVTEIDGTLVHGYDTRTPDALGPVTGRPEDHVDNPYLDDARAVFAGPTADDSPEETRYPFEPLPLVPVAGVTLAGGEGDDVLAAAAPDETMPAPLSHWRFEGAANAFVDLRGGPTARAYTLHENQALPRLDGLVAGPSGMPALSFDGEDDYAFIPHDPRFSVTQGTIALWFRPDDLGDDGALLAKDERGNGDGGHFRLGHTDDGGLFLRLAEGDGGRNQAWETGPLLTEGSWHHVAVSFTATGVTVSLDGVAIEDGAWTTIEGDVESPGVYREAYLLQNEEPFVLGADQRRTQHNETAQVFAIDDDKLDSAFTGAIAEVAVWGGFTPDDALSADEVATVAAGFDVAAIAAPALPHGIASGADALSGGGGADQLAGEGGDDTLAGEAGDDTLAGGYGDDSLSGGEGADDLDGGRGSDLLEGGAGDDVLLSRADVGEDRAGQLVLGEPTRPFPDASIDPELLKLVDWADQPVVGDDILVGGEGADHFLFETLINGKKDIILEHVNDDVRTIDWGGVAGENKRIHDHWVDGIGIDVVADFDADEDRISVIGHTTNVEVNHRAVDTEGDGTDDGVVSVVTLLSQQGRGGAHDEDILGYVVVHGDLVHEDDIETDAGVHYGIVDTLDELQGALAPTGAPKLADLADGTRLSGYDSRDVAGDPIGTDPEAFAQNPYAAAVEPGTITVRDLPPLAVAAAVAGGTFHGTSGGEVEIAHEAAMRREAGTIAFTFSADTPGEGNRALVSKDHVGHKDGGHFTAWISDRGFLEVRFQHADGESRTLKYRDERIVPGEEYSLAFSFAPERIALYVNGTLADTEEGFADGMLGNFEDLLIGASARRRNGDDPNAEWHFEGSIGEIAFFDRPLLPPEAILLARAGGDPSAIGATPPPVGEAPEPDPEPVAGLPGTDGPDRLVGTARSEHLVGHDGNDRLIGGGADDILDGGAGNDILHGGEGSDDMAGGPGNDRYIVDDVDDTIDEAEGAGRDRIVSAVDIAMPDHVELLAFRGDGPFEAIGNDLDNRMAGGDGDDALSGEGGRDRLVGRAGDDILSGGAGNDVIHGGNGADHMDGGMGNDVYVVDDPNDTILEAADGGTDLVRSSTGYALDEHVERLSLMPRAVDAEGIGNDLDNRLAGNRDDNVLLGEGGADVIVGGSGDDLLEGAAGNDRLVGGKGVDLLVGGDGADRVLGGAGHDVLEGGAGDDIVVGGAGEDVIDGGAGLDRLVGSGGRDTFLLADPGADEPDRIVDFAPGVDVLVIGADLLGVTEPADLSLAFHEGWTAADADHRILYDPSRGSLAVDPDGTGTASPTTLALLRGNIALSAADIEVV